MEKSLAEAGERIAQKAEVWIDHVEATNKAPLNVISTNLLHNQKGTYEGDLIGEINTFENEAGHLKLGAEMSSLKVETMRSSAESSIVGEGGIQILSKREFHEKGEVKLGDAYQVQVQLGNLDIDHDVLAKNVHLQAIDGKVGVSEGVTILISEKGTLDGNQVDNRGLVESAGSLEIYQKQYQDPGAVRGEKLLKLYSVSPIDLKQPMQTSGDLAIISEKMVHIHASLDVENDLFLKGTGVNLWERAEVSGRGIFHSVGNVELHHMQAIFRKGIAVDAKGFLIHTSDVDIIGDSAIKVEKFLLESTVIVPHFWYTNTTHPYRHIPSNFRVIGNLHLDASVQAINDASNLLIKGNMLATGQDMENNNRMHLYHYAVHIGTCHSGRIRRKKIELYRYESVLVTDGWANSQISETLELGLESLRNTGIVVAYDIRGRIARLYNGIFTSQGRTPTFVPALPCVEGFSIPQVKAGGFFGTWHDVRLTTDLTHNTGFMDAQNVFSLFTKELLLAKRVVHETVDAVKKRSLGRKSKVTFEIDSVQPGAEINARETYLHVDRGTARGGTVAGEELAYIEGGDFTLDAVPVRSVVPLNPGRVALWKSAPTAAVKTSFAGAKVISKKVRSNLEGTLTVNGSTIISLHKTALFVGKFLQRTLFSHYVSSVKRGYSSSKKFHTIVMEEPSTQCLDGPFIIETHKTDIIWEGLLASLNGPLRLKSKRHIYALSRTHSVNNPKKKASVAVAEERVRKIDFNTTRTSLPKLIAGKGTTFKAKSHLDTEGLQAQIIGDMDVTADTSWDHGHVVTHYQKVKEGSLGVSVFGMRAIKSLVEGGGVAGVGEALISENPAIESYFKLARSKDIAGIFTNSILAIKNTWGEAAKLSQAFNQGNLGTALAQQFNPGITISVGFSKQKTEWTQTYFSTFTIIHGSLNWNVRVQRHTGGLVNVDEDAVYTGETITGEAGVDSLKQNGGGGNLSLTFGGYTYFDVGVDGSRTRAKGKQHTPWRVNTGNDLKFNASKRLNLPGAQLEGEHVDIKTPVLDGESQQDTFSQTSISAGASLSGRVSLSYNREQSAQVNQATWIKARQSGTIETDSTRLRGVLTQNMVHNTPNFQFEDIPDVNRGRGFNVSLMGKAILDRPKDQGFTELGTIDFHWNKQKGVTRTTVAGGNGAALGGVNTSADRFQEKGKKKKFHFATPLIDWNNNALALEAEEIGKVFNSTPMSRPVVQPAVVEEMPSLVEKPVERVEESSKQEEALSATEMEALQALVKGISEAILSENLKKQQPVAEEDHRWAEKQLALYHDILSTQEELDPSGERRVPTKLDIYKNMLSSPEELDEWVGGRALMKSMLFRRVPTIPELRAKNPLFDVSHASVNQSMGLADMGHDVLKAFIFTVGFGLKSMVDSRSRELRVIGQGAALLEKGISTVLSKVNPALEQECRNADLLTQAILKEYTRQIDRKSHILKNFPKRKMRNFLYAIGVGQHGIADRVIESYKRSRESFAIHLEQNLAIPIAQGRKFSDDSLALQVALITPPVFRFLKMPIASLVRASVKGVSKAHYLYSRAYPKIYTKEQFERLGLNLNIVTEVVRKPRTTVYQVGGPQRLITSGQGPAVSVVPKSSIQKPSQQLVRRDIKPMQEPWVKSSPHILIITTITGITRETLASFGNSIKNFLKSDFGGGVTFPKSMSQKDWVIEFKAIGYKEELGGGKGSKRKMKKEGCRTVNIGRKITPLRNRNLTKTYNEALSLEKKTKPHSFRKSVACAIEDDVFIERIPDANTCYSHQESENIVGNVVYYLGDNWIPKGRFSRILYRNKRSSEFYHFLRDVENGRRITKKTGRKLAKTINSSEEKLLETPPPPLPEISRILLKKLDRKGIDSISHAAALWGVPEDKLYRVVNLREDTFTPEEIIKIRKYTGFGRDELKDFASPEAASVQPTATLSEAKNVGDNLNILGAENWLSLKDVARKIAGKSKGPEYSEVYRTLISLQKGEKVSNEFVEFASVSFGVSPDILRSAPKNRVSSTTLELIEGMHKALDGTIIDVADIINVADITNITQERLYEVTILRISKFTKEEVSKLAITDIGMHLLVDFVGEDVDLMAFTHGRTHHSKKHLAEFEQSNQQLKKFCPKVKFSMLEKRKFFVGMKQLCADASKDDSAIQDIEGVILKLRGRKGISNFINFIEDETGAVPLSFKEASPPGPLYDMLSEIEELPIKYEERELTETAANPIKTRTEPKKVPKSVQLKSRMTFSVSGSPILF